MFSFRIQDIALMMAKTLILVFIFDFLSSTFFPTFQKTYLFPSFHILIVIFLAFNQPSNRIPFLILIISAFHSMFTVEGWAIGTITGCIVGIILVSIRDTIQFSSYIATFFLVFVVQVLWSSLSGVLLSLKLDQWEVLRSYFVFSITQGIVLGITALPIFKILEKIWQKKDTSVFTSEQVM